MSKRLIELLELNFYPRSPCGERQPSIHMSYLLKSISIHALLAESDAVMDNIVFVPREFLSTLSLRRATTLIWDVMAVMTISIHALLAESDREPTALRTPHQNFYPRSPCGERQLGKIDCGKNWQFLSTLSLRRATGKSNKLAELKLVFLSTLSLRRATFSAGTEYDTAENFYPRSPCGERLFSLLGYFLHYNFYPRSPCGERLVDALELANAMLFLSTLSLRRATDYG